MNFDCWVSIFVVLLSPSLHQCCRKLHNGAFSLSDDVEFAAIKSIHNQLDDNADGSVDFQESEEFVKTELCGPGKEGMEKKIICMESEKSLKFHQMDMEITSTELWITWHKNEVFNWTNNDVLDWLEHSVELPQYANTFKHHQITGRQLPYIAINSGQILQNTLLITDSQHKQKIQLRAMDIILFGPPVQHGYWKDAILVVSIILCLCGILYALRQRMLSKSRIDSFIANLRLKEEEVKRLKSKFEELELSLTDVTDGKTDEKEEGNEDSPILMTEAATVSAGSPSLDEDRMSSFCKNCSQDPELAASQAQENIDLLQKKVWSLEAVLEEKDMAFKMLQVLLPECQQKEKEHLEFRKLLGEEQIARAQRACEKIRKRRSSLFGTFHLANSSMLEEVGLQITKALNKMRFISEYFEEHHKRWSKMGQVTSLLHSPETNDPYMLQSSPASFPVLPRQVIDGTEPDDSLFLYKHHSIPSGMSARHYSLNKSLTSSGPPSSSSGRWRNSLQFGSLVHSQFPSLKDQMMDYRKQTTMDRDSAFPSNALSAQSCASSSVGSHSSIGSHSSTSEETKHQYDSDGSITKMTSAKMRSKHFRKKGSRSNCVEEGLVHSSHWVTSAVRNRAKPVCSSDV